MAPSGVPTIRISAAQRAEYDAIGDDLIQRALTHHDAFHRAETLDRWKLVRHRDALSVYKDRNHGAATTAAAAGAANTSKSSLMMCSGLVPGTLDELVRGMYSDSTESLRVTESILSGRLLDCAMVHVFEANEFDAPVIFTGIKWFAVKTPGGQFVRDRDILSFERMGRIVDRHGAAFAYRVLQSIDLAEWPANRDRTLARVRMSACYLFRRVSADWVGCFVIGDFDAGGSVPPVISEYLAADSFLSEGRILKCAHAKAFSALAVAHIDRIASTSKQCDLCLATPTFSLRRAMSSQHKLCVGCRRRVCPKCREKRVVFRLNARTRRPERERFCRECVDRVVHRSSTWRSGINDTYSSSCSSYELDEPEEVGGDGDDSASPPHWGFAPGLDSASSSSPSGSLSLTPGPTLSEQWTQYANACAETRAREDSGRADPDFVWNRVELQWLTARLGSSRKKKRTRHGRTFERLTPPAELQRHLEAASDRSSGNLTLPPVRPRPRSGTDAVFQHYRVTQPHSVQRTWTPPSTSSASVSRTPHVAAIFDPLQRSDPEAAYEAFKAAAARTQRTGTVSYHTLAPALVFDEAVGEFVPVSRGARESLQLQTIRIDELD